MKLVLSNVDGMNKYMDEQGAQFTNRQGWSGVGSALPKVTEKVSGRPKFELGSSDSWPPATHDKQTETSIQRQQGPTGCQALKCTVPTLNIPG